MDDYSNSNNAVDDTIEVTITVTDMDSPAVPDQPTVDRNLRRGRRTDRHLGGRYRHLRIAPVDGYDVQYRVKDATNPDQWNGAAPTSP